MTNGSSTTFSGDLSVQFNHTFADRHDVFATGQYNISQTKYSEVTNYTGAADPNNQASIQIRGISSRNAGLEVVLYMILE